MENINQDNLSPIVEKVSVKELKSEKTKIELEEEPTVNNFIKAAMALNDKELDKAIDFIRKKHELLKK